MGQFYVPEFNLGIRIFLAAILAYTTAAPALLLGHEAEFIHSVPLTAKSTITRSNQVVDHGSTLIHSPIVPVVHQAPLIHAASVDIPASKFTVTKSSQVVNHGSTAVVHSVPLATHIQDAVVAVPSKTTVTKSNQIVDHGTPLLAHSAPLLAHSAPLVSLKTGDSAVSHHQSTVHETVPVVKSVPLVSLYH
ncbi:uncharacterized protein LOC131841408 [Achroia grisella]|uniref:uncharacterized protein LOC131841408 n=1 Tax=Achroia grisella TaxID=688607 RepID=UPI0027D29B48|nr:uncharacterized protein LOC131841408 [Achroia grisella]